MAIPYSRQVIDEDDVAAVVGVLRGDWLTQGPSTARFEQAVADICDVPYAVAFSSGTAALHAAAFAAGAGEGNELVTSALSFAASANCALYVGATPRFADIDPDTLNVSAESVTAASTARTRVVIPVHFAGLPAPVREIREAVGPDIVIVEDAAHALGARTEEEMIGACAHSDMTVFSFHPVKTVTTAEGGMVTTQDRELYETLVMFRHHGLTKDPARLVDRPGAWHQEQQLLGFNYRLSDVHSALGLSQLHKMHGFVAARNEVARRYREALRDVEVLELPPVAPEGVRHAYHLFVVRHRGGTGARRALYDALRERDILVQVHYPPIYTHPYYRGLGYREGLCPEVERYSASCLSLPCYPTLSEDEQDEVIEAVREACAA